MNKPYVLPGITTRLLRKLGGYYVLVALLLAQVITIPLGIIITAQVVSTNADLSASQISSMIVFVSEALLTRTVLIMILFYFIYQPVISRLNKWSKGISLDRGTEEEKKAWRQITSIAWHYIAIAVGLLLFVIIPVTLAYLYYGLGGNTNQVLYTLFGAIAGGFSMAILEVLIAESLLTGARLALLPHAYEHQISGITGVRMLSKFQIAFLVLILVTVLLISPIGYRQTNRVLYEEIGSQQVLVDLQIQSLVVAGFSLLLGFGLSYLLTRNISQSVQQMVETFNRVEQGDLKQRLDITATDEIGELSVHFNRMLARLEEFQSRLEEQVDNRTAQLKTTVEVGRVASGILQPDELIARVVNLITDRFGYYYASLFLIDPTGRWAELENATGDAGKRLVSERHRLEIGGKSMVGTAIATRQARIALDVGIESVRFDNPLLPETRSEIALPLVIGDRAIGALDVQSTKEAAFQEEDINTLQGMANQVAIALENARLFQETQKNLEELRAAHRAYVSSSWIEKERDHEEYEYRATEDQEGKSSTSVNIPITLREQVIGQLSLEGDQEWTQEERVLIEAVATQAALALENARLLEESQQLALRERLAAEIISKIWASNNFESILQTAVKELGRALRADEALIEIKTE